MQSREFSVETNMGALIVVKATFDDEAGVWFAQSADLPGLWIEADSVEALTAKLPGAILDLTVF